MKPSDLPPQLRVRMGIGIPTKPKRRKVGDVTALKQWQAEMCRGPGIFVPVKVISEANAREHWRVAWQRGKDQKERVSFAMAGRVGDCVATLAVGGTIRVTLTRYGKRMLDDDNLARGFKAIRDAIAAKLGKDDGLPCYQWIYRQEVAKHYGVRIELEAV